jgi:hypothetical protein
VRESNPRRPVWSRTSSHWTNDHHEPAGGYHLSRFSTLPLQCTATGTARQQQPRGNEHELAAGWGSAPLHPSPKHRGSLRGPRTPASDLAVLDVGPWSPPTSEVFRASLCTCTPCPRVLRSPLPSSRSPCIQSLRSNSLTLPSQNTWGKSSRQDGIFGSTYGSWHGLCPGAARSGRNSAGC